MFQIDESQAPLIIMRFDSPLTLQSYQEVITYFEKLLDAAQPFAMLMESSSEGQHEKGVNQAQKQWLKQNKSRFGQHCVGFAMLTHSSRFIVLYKPIANRMIQQIYGCPGKLFTQESEAKVWLEQALNASKMN